MPAPPDPLNDEDLLGLDVSDILHALLAPMESPASYQQQGHGPCAPLPQILLAHSLCAPNVDDASVGNLIAPAPAPALVAATVPVHNASGDDFKLSHLCTEKRDLGRLYNGSRATSSIPPKIGF